MENFYKRERKKEQITNKNGKRNFFSRSFYLFKARCFKLSVMTIHVFIVFVPYCMNIILLVKEKSQPDFMKRGQYAFIAYNSMKILTYRKKYQMSFSLTKAVET